MCEYDEINNQKIPSFLKFVTKMLTQEYSKTKKIKPHFFSAKSSLHSPCLLKSKSIIIHKDQSNERESKFLFIFI